MRRRRKRGYGMPDMNSMKLDELKRHHLLFMAKRRALSHREMLIRLISHLATERQNVWVLNWQGLSKEASNSVVGLRGSLSSFLGANSYTTQATELSAPRDLLGDNDKPPYSFT